jgi:hypothetical protein
VNTLNLADLSAKADQHAMEFMPTEGDFDTRSLAIAQQWHSVGPSEVEQIRIQHNAHGKPVSKLLRHAGYITAAQCETICYGKQLIDAGIIYF